MARGRKPKPTNLKLIDGNAGKRKIPQAEPAPEPIELPCPNFLEDDPVARAEWDRLMPELRRWGLFTMLDLYYLAGFCQAVSQWRGALDALASWRSRSAALTQAQRDL